MRQTDAIGRTFICHISARRCPRLLCRELLGQAVALHERVVLVGHVLCVLVLPGAREEGKREEGGAMMQPMPRLGSGAWM